MVPTAITSADMMALVTGIVRRPARMIVAASAEAGDREIDPTDLEAPTDLEIDPAADGVATGAVRDPAAGGRVATDSLGIGMTEGGRAPHAMVVRSSPDGTDTAAVTTGAAMTGAVTAAVTTGAVTTGGMTAEMAVGPLGATVARAASTAVEATPVPAGQAAAQARAAASGSLTDRRGGIGRALAATVGVAEATAGGPPAMTTGGVRTDRVDRTAEGRVPAAVATSGVTIAAAAAGPIGEAIGAKAGIAGRARTPVGAMSGETNRARIPRVTGRTDATTIAAAAGLRRGATVTSRRGRRAPVMAVAVGATTAPGAVMAAGRAATTAVPTAGTTTAGAATARTTAGRAEMTARIGAAAVTVGLAAATTVDPRARTVEMTAPPVSVRRRAVATRAATTQTAARTGVPTARAQPGSAAVTTTGSHGTPQVATAAAKTATLEVEPTLGATSVVMMATTGVAMPAHRAIETRLIAGQVRTGARSRATRTPETAAPDATDVAATIDRVPVIG